MSANETAEQAAVYAQEIMRQQAVIADLLEALEHCANHLKQIAAEQYPNATPQARIFNSERHARAAIAKATEEVLWTNS